MSRPDVCSVTSGLWIHTMFWCRNVSYVAAVCLFFSYLTQQEQSDHEWTRYGRMIITPKSNCRRLFTERPFFMWFPVPPLPMGGSHTEPFFGWWCCSGGWRGWAKGSSVLQRGNGRSPWKVWMEWLKKWRGRGKARQEWTTERGTVL